MAAMNRILIGTVICAALMLVSCASRGTRINNSREKRALKIARDLKAHKESSVYYRRTSKLVEVEKGIRVISIPKLEVWFSEWPLGPKVIIDVLTEKISYYD